MSMTSISSNALLFLLCPSIARITPSTILVPYQKKKYSKIPTAAVCLRTANYNNAINMTQMVSNKPFETFKLRGAEGRAWVDTVKVHHALLCNHFIDLLDLYGTSHGLHPYKGPSYAKRMRLLSREFRRQVLGALSRAVGLENVILVPSDEAEEDASTARAITISAIQGRASLIINPVLGDDASRILARPHAIIRTDVAQRLIGVFDDEALDTPFVLVAIKRRLLQTKANDTKVLKRKAVDRLQAETWLWKKLLSEHVGASSVPVAVIGLAQNRKCPVADGALMTVDATMLRDGEVWRAALIEHFEQNGPNHPAQRALSALEWQIAAVDHGASWLQKAVDVFRCRQRTDGTGFSALHALAATTQDPRQRPNMKIADMYDWPWASVKRSIAQSFNELTLVSGVSNATVSAALGRGLPNDYKHPGVTPLTLDVENLLTQRSLQMCKQGYDGPIVLPQVIPHNQGNWRLLRHIEENASQQYRNAEQLERWDERSFYVDFELVSADMLQALPGNLNAETDHERKLAEHIDVVPSWLPSSDHQIDPLIFMIGCGRLVRNKWEYHSFIARSLSVQAEHEIVSACIQFMSNAVEEFDDDSIYVFVWGPEQQLLRKAINRMRRHHAMKFTDLTRFKMINVLQLITSVRLAIQGNMSNSIKSVRNALEEHGLLDHVHGVNLNRGSMNGMDIMALTLDAVEKTRDNGVHHLADVAELKEVQNYNETDCSDIAQIITYLRKNH